MSRPIIVFDLDGTLVDTAPDLVATLNLIFEREGLPTVPYDEARKLIGGGARAMIVRGLEADRRTVTPERLDELFRDFIAHYTAHVADLSRPFPGVAEALDALGASGHPFAVCTNKFERQSLMLLEALKLSDRFKAICGQDTFGIAKPDPEMLRRTILAAGGDPARAIMIGDSETDILTARAAGLPVIAVDFGYSEEPVATYAPDRLISHFSQLPQAIAALLDDA
ncbi:MAG: phosphoglycolate phosphatase [Proteobacteria bacterium]|nr:phosphoglycolate phosphatase [Pseudomonadota bacterium]